MTIRLSCEPWDPEGKHARVPRKVGPETADKGEDALTGVDWLDRSILAVKRLPASKRGPLDMRILRAYHAWTGLNQNDDRNPVRFIVEIVTRISQGPGKRFEDPTPSMYDCVRAAILRRGLSLATTLEESMQGIAP